MAGFLVPDSHELTVEWAYQLWEARGRSFGSPKVDWFAAEKALASAQRDPKPDLPRWRVTLEANGGPFGSLGSANQK